MALKHNNLMIFQSTKVCMAIFTVEFLLHWLAECWTGAGCCGSLIGILKDTGELVPGESNRRDPGIQLMLKSWGKLQQIFSNLGKWEDILVYFAIFCTCASHAYRIDACIWWKCSWHCLIQDGFDNSYRSFHIDGRIPGSSLMSCVFWCPGWISSSPLFSTSVLALPPLRYFEWWLGAAQKRDWKGRRKMYVSWYFRRNFRWFPWPINLDTSKFGRVYPDVWWCLSKTEVRLMRLLRLVRLLRILQQLWLLLSSMIASMRVLFWAIAMLASICHSSCSWKSKKGFSGFPGLKWPLPWFSVLVGDGKRLHVQVL